MNSLEALHNYIETKSCINCPNHEECDEGVNCPCDEWEKTIKQDLERLEHFEKPKIARYLNYETGRVQCPTCKYKIPIRKNKIANNINYCPKCGQSLVFSEIELEEYEVLHNEQR